MKNNWRAFLIIDLLASSKLKAHSWEPGRILEKQNRIWAWCVQTVIGEAAVRQRDYRNGAKLTFL
jgi:hypothetical protein